MNPLQWIEYEILGNSLLLWTLGVGLFLIVWLMLLFLRRVLSSRLHAFSDAREVTAIETAQDTVAVTKSWFLLVVAIFVGSRLWTLPTRVDSTLASIVTIVLLLQAGLWCAAAFTRFLDIRRKRELEENPGAVAAMDVLSFIVLVAIWSVVLLVMLDNLGFNITTLIAGLGVGGIAVALAAQNILGDLFASLSIVLDKPFVVGDFLSIGEFVGSVEKVGIKTTRVRSLSGEQLIFSNNDLLGSRIRNFGRMFERRVVFSIGVTYQTPAEKLKQIQVILKESVEAQNDVRFDRAHFHKYGDFALLFEIVYYVLSPDYNKYMDIQQAINLILHERFEQEGIEFAYPTQTVYMTRNE